MENPCESNSSLTKPNRDNILAQGQYSVQLMQLRLVSSYYTTLQPNLFLLNLQAFENKKIMAFDCFHKLWWVTFFCFALSMIVLVISCTFDLYCKLYYEIELVTLISVIPNKAFKKNQKPKTKNMAVMQAVFQYFVHHSTKICLPLQLWFTLHQKIFHSRFKLKL